MFIPSVFVGVVSLDDLCLNGGGGGHMFLAPELIHGYFTSNNRRGMLKSHVFKSVVSNTRSHLFAIKISGTFCILII